MATAGARVVLNDLPGAADEAAAEIKALGAEVVVAAGDVGERSTADLIMQTALESFGSLDIVVNNAGVTRDKMLFNMSDEEFDLVVRIHLRGHFLLSRNAASHWKQLAKESGAPVDASVINTASEAFLTGSPGQANYAAAKAGITALTLSTARGLVPHRRARQRDLPPRPHGHDGGGVRSRRVRQRRRPLQRRSRGPAGRLPGVAGCQPHHWTGVRRLRRDGRAAWRLPSWSSASTPTSDVFSPDELDRTLGGFFADRDPETSFAADSILSL